jgi:homoserine/homoserine lactone efflux protein
MSPSLWLAFFIASWAISLSPGPGAIAVMSASLNHGFARGCFATFGLILGFWTQLAGEPLLPQYLVIGATLGFTDLVVNMLYAALAARLLGVLRAPARRRAINRVFGSLFVALAVLLATFKRA